MNKCGPSEGLVELIIKIINIIITTCVNRFLEVKKFRSDNKH